MSFQCLADNVGWAETGFPGLGIELPLEPLIDAVVDALHLQCAGLPWLERNSISPSKVCRE
jgi:hypothetical protein